MKKLLMTLSFAAILGTGLFFSGSAHKSAGSSLTRSNIEMLSASAEVNVEVLDPGAGDLTGPRKEVDCKTMSSPHKMACYCENSNACSDSDCY